MNNLLEKEIHSLVFERFIEKAMERYDEIIKQINEEYKKKNFSLLDFLNLQGGNRHYIDGFENIKKEILLYLKKDSVESENVLDKKSDIVINKLKFLKSFLKAPIEYKEIQVELDKEKYYNEKILIKEIENDISRMFLEIMEMVLKYSKDYGNDYISNMDEIINQFNERQGINSSISLLVDFVEEFAEEDELKKSLNELKAKEKFDLNSLYDIVQKYTKRQDNAKKSTFKVNKIKLNLSIEFSDTRFNNIDVLYKKRCSSIYDNKYRSLLDKYLTKTRYI